MNALITGGAGYLGSKLVGELLSHGWAVTVVDVFKGGAYGLLPYCGHKGFKVVVGDCSKDEVMRPLVRAANVIFPFAAVVGGLSSEADYENCNTIPITRLINDWVAGDQVVVFPMTNAGYCPLEGAFVNEDTPFEPRSNYGMSKLKAEQVVLSYPKGISLRLASVFGVSGNMREYSPPLVNWLVQQAVKRVQLRLSAPEALRDVIHIEDAARAFYFVADDRTNELYGRVFNVGLVACTKRFICDVTKRHVPGFSWEIDPTAYTDLDARDFAVSYDRIYREGFRCHRTLDEGIEELVKAYRML